MNFMMVHEIKNLGVSGVIKEADRFSDCGNFLMVVSLVVL